MYKKLSIYLALVALALITVLYLVFRDKTSDASLTPITIWQDNCLDSCWNNLRPKKISETEVLKFISDNLIGYQTYSDKGMTFHVASLPEKYNINAYLKGDMLVGMKLEAKQAFNLSIGDVLQKLGEPSYTAIGYNPKEFQPELALISLFYPDNGFVFHAHLAELRQNGNEVNMCIRETDHIFRLSIVESGTIHKVITEANYPFAFSMTEQQLQDFIARLKPWSGFTCVS
jgi:hypothetical protein